MQDIVGLYKGWPYNVGDNQLLLEYAVTFLNIQFLSVFTSIPLLFSLGCTNVSEVTETMFVFSSTVLST